jgi:hypothetical protein
MLNHLRRSVSHSGAVPEAADAQRTFTLVPMADAMAAEWPSHTRRCLHRLPAQLRWATPVLDPDHPHTLECTHEQARELLLWLNRLPSHEHPIVGCHHRRGPA